MAFWRVTYSGLWLGGEAIVVAETAEEAIRAVREHPDTRRFEDVAADPIPVPGTPAVLLNNNGDY